ncbi:MAG: DUF2384 domain-containing protein [Bacteroidetes bacterium]|nr:DUF2384 domain-containing protein [Bacteroidota bacterium]
MKPVPSQVRLNKEINRYFLALRDKTALSVTESGITYSDFLANKLLVILAIRNGIPFHLFSLIKDQTPFSETDWADLLNISVKSLQRYKQEADHCFKPAHSEKIIEIAEVTQAGLEVFGSVEKLSAWLGTPNFALAGMKPQDLLKDSYGKDLVLSELTRISHGIFA